MNQFKCKVCKKIINKERIRQHVGKHILKKETQLNQRVCGFCGLVGCSIDLKVTSGYGKNKTEGADSNCMYFVKFSYQHAINSSERSPCTNRPVVCMQCKQCIWSYNILIHYNEVHPGVLILETCQPNDKEIKQVLSLKI